MAFKVGELNENTLQKRCILTTSINYLSMFIGSSGKAYLFKAVSNIIVSQIEEKQMTTGKHIVRDVFCKLCQVSVFYK